MFSEIQRIDRTLRPYQQEAKEQIFAAWEDYTNVMFQMPTGTGKTRLFTSIINDVKTWSILNHSDAKILIIAHRVELIDQISESLDKYKISHGLIAGGKDRDLHPLVQVASIQTITHHSNEDLARDMSVAFIIIDEAHHAMANTYKKLWTLYPNAKKLGVTATPWRMNGCGFTSCFEKIILSKQIKEFIKEGWLAPYSYYSIDATSDLQKNINSIDEFDIEGDYKIAALEKVVDNQKIRAQLLDSYLQLAKGKKGIIYSISRKHSEHICSQYRAAGINVVCIDSQTPKEERRLYVNRFKNGQIDIIVNVDIFSEGFDCPDIEFVQLARPTRSLVKFLQQVGRGLRPTKNKSNCIILDNVGIHTLFGLPDTDRDWQGDFIGSQKEQKQSYASSSYTADTPRSNDDFIEGNDTLKLIESVDTIESKALPGNSSQEWSEKDLQLLYMLYVERNCPIDLIASIFKISNESVALKIQEQNWLPENL